MPKIFAWNSFWFRIGNENCAEHFNSFHLQMSMIADQFDSFIDRIMCIGHRNTIENCSILSQLRYQTFLFFDALVNLIIDKEERKCFSNALHPLFVSTYIMYKYLSFWRTRSLLAVAAPTKVPLGRKIRSDPIPHILLFWINFQKRSPNFTTFETNIYARYSKYNIVYTHNRHIASQKKATAHRTCKYSFCFFCCRCCFVLPMYIKYIIRFAVIRASCSIYNSIRAVYELVLCTLYIALYNLIILCGEICIYRKGIKRNSTNVENPMKRKLTLFSPWTKRNSSSRKKDIPQKEVKKAVLCDKQATTRGQKQQQHRNRKKKNQERKREQIQSG